MRLIKTLLKLLIPIIFGYWLAVSQIASGTILGDALEGIMDYLPVTSQRWHHHDWSNHIPFISVIPERSEPRDHTEIPSIHGNTVTSKLNESQINEQLIKDYVLKLTNDLRAKKGLHKLTMNKELELAGDIRANETMSVFSHTRPNGEDPFTVLTDSNASPNYDYQFIGENLGMATYHRSDTFMAEMLFDGWVDSEGHYQNIINENFTEIGIGVDYDGEYLYVTQFFGAPLF